MKNILLALLLLPFLALAQTEKGASPLSSPQGTSTGATYAVVVGISDYQDKDIPDLRFADRDAEAFANFLRSPAGGGVDGDHLKVLTNDQATAGRIAEALDGLIEQVKEGDHIIIYFSGHGDVERKIFSQPGFLLCWDAPSRVYMGGGTYSLAYLEAVVTTLSVQNKARVAVITDACHAGKLSGSQIGGAQLTSANLAKQYANEIKILSCQPNEFSLEGEQWGGGRGVFSFHLVDGLPGLADRNGDAGVTVGEIDRYLEDHVAPEVAPQSQVPIVLGNKTERLAQVFPEILAEMQKGKAGQMAVFSKTENRGLEDEVLAGVDSSIRELYRFFQKALDEKAFFAAIEGQPCADFYFEKLAAEPGLARLHNAMRRNYAAALQDDAQQAMNIWLKADVQQLECIGKSLRLEPIPRQLARAAELLGEGHYMYRSLQARRLLFEGIQLNGSSINPDESLARQCLALYRKAEELEPLSPLPWYRMSLTYMNNLRQFDSAFVCAGEARKLSPNWVLPFAALGLYLTGFHKFDLAKLALQEAEKIDSLHPYIINRWAYWHNVQGGLANQEKALALFEKYRQSGGAMYPCWHQTYGSTLQALDRDAAAEAEIEIAISIDSTMASGWARLGALFVKTHRYAEAETAIKKAIALDSTMANPRKHLGMVCFKTNRPDEARQNFLKALELNPNYAGAMLGMAYLSVEALAKADAPASAKASAGKEAIGYVEQAIGKGSTFEQLESDEDLAPLREQKEQWKALMKQYFPEKVKD